MTFDEMLEQAWSDHADHPAAVADRLVAAAPTIASAEQLAPFARIVTHVYGEHLGECERGVSLLNSLRKLPVYAETPEVGGIVTRAVATLRFLGGDSNAATALAVLRPAGVGGEHHGLAHAVALEQGVAGALAPGVDVFQQPFAVLLFVRQHVGIERQ